MIHYWQHLMEDGPGKPVYHLSGAFTPDRTFCGVWINDDYKEVTMSEYNKADESNKCDKCGRY
jgi:hypothetical protein